MVTHFAFGSFLPCQELRSANQALGTYEPRTSLRCSNPRKLKDSQQLQSLLRSSVPSARLIPERLELALSLRVDTLTLPGTQLRSFVALLSEGAVSLSDRHWRRRRKRMQ